MYYPIVLKIAGRSVVIVGGGEVAEGKTQALLQSGASVTIVSPELTPQLRSLADSGAILWHRRPYESADVHDAFLVIAATDDEVVQAQVWQDARENKVLTNTVDRLDRCDFIMPSVIRRDDLIVSVSTSGKSPAFAAWLRRKIAGIVTSEFGRVVALLGFMRNEVHDRFNSVGERKRAYQRILDTGIVKWIRHCDDATAKRRIHDILQEL